MSEEWLPSGNLRVRIQPLLMELIPPYLKRRGEELVLLKKLLADGDFHAIGELGHKLSGNAATFGFHGLSELGEQLETAASRKDGQKIETLIGSLGNYLGKIEVQPLA